MIRCGSSARRSAVVAPARIDPGLRRGLVFMTLHFPDEVDVNRLTIEANDPKSGTAEFKATAVRLERVDAEERPPARQLGLRGGDVLAVST